MGVAGGPETTFFDKTSLSMPIIPVYDFGVMRRMACLSISNLAYRQKCLYSYPSLGAINPGLLNL
jgi:hypothetical protein